MILDKEQIREAMKPIRAFILDMDGTIYLGNELFPYTRRFLDSVKRIISLQTTPQRMS